MTYISACGVKNFKLKNNEKITLEPEPAKKQHYVTNIVCLYRVIASDDPDQILLRINHFDLELDYDFLIIGHGDGLTPDKSTELVVLTGQPKLRTIVSPGNVWLTLITDSSSFATGYNIDFRIIDEESLEGKSDTYS